MRLSIDTAAGTLVWEEGADRKTLGLYTPAAFRLLSQQWVRVGWSQRYSYNFAWQGRPVIQLPEDLVRAQEVIYRLQPDLIIETGVAYGGSLIFYASLCRLVGRGRVVGIDIEIRPQNREAIESHDLASLIALVEGSSTAPDVVKRVQSLVGPGERVLVFLDSNHSRSHVLAELEAYHHFVTPESYIVATDGIMGDLQDVPGGRTEWREDNPAEAAREFARAHTEFVLEQPPWPFTESPLTENVTYWPGAWLRRLE